MYKQAFNRLPEFFRKENTEKIYYILYGDMKDLLDAIDIVENSRDVDKASGNGLDLMGNNIGQDRNGMSDEDYRLMIKTKIIANRSKGDIPTINEVSSVLFPENYSGIQELFNLDNYNEPAGMLINFKPGFKDIQLDIYDRLKAGGVSIKQAIEFEDSDTTIASINLSGEVVTLYPKEEDDE